METVQFNPPVTRKFEGTPSFMSLEDIGRVCPYALKSTPTNPSVTEQYTHVNTLTVIEDLAKVGWYPVQASQRKVRQPGTIFSKHMVKFQNDQVFIEKSNGEKSFIEIVLVNSHDGFTSFRFMIGLYRLVCSNGLIIADKEFESIRIRHIGYTFAELLEVVHTSIKRAEDQVKIMNTMTERVLTQLEKEQLAAEALRLRFNFSPESPEAKNLVENKELLENVLEPTREEDNDNDMWTVFNIIQEKVIKGGFNVTLEGKRTRKLRKIDSFEKDIKINQDLFKLATSLL